ncbi:head GIN domain-containing protein [Salinimicrobium sp. HB62]|uniref:head GIN domain-containing protein n=1 Tax=Salinimicrobium sp. HB62 TaxID=3077781 RepID=UPI002D7918D3|nr:head GIN domain-containing protein [Salinimicrobium sp. HB62]
MKLKTNIRSTFLFPLMILFLSLSVAAQDVEKELGDFTEVKTFNAVEVEIIPSDKNKIVITGHSKNDVKFDIVEDRLEIRLSLDNIWSKNNTRITLYTKDLATIDANEGSIVEVSGEIKGQELTFRTQEAANILARVNSRKIHAKAVSGGKITLEGKAEEQVVETNTGGHYYGKDLRTSRAEVSAGTAGKGEVYATDYVKATAKLGGTVEIFGNPAEVDKKTSLGGRIL